MSCRCLVALPVCVSEGSGGVRWWVFLFGLCCEFALCLWHYVRWCASKCIAMACALAADILCCSEQRRHDGYVTGEVARTPRVP